jgi:ferric-dicitrate binding protein FerR (iron transport regulator)
MNEQQVGKASHIASLIIRRMQNRLTDDEWTELETWLQEDGENYLLYEELMDEEKLGAALDDLHTIDHNMAYEKLSQKLSLSPKSPKHIHLRIWWYMVAALLVLIAGGIFYFNTDTKTVPSKTPPPLVTAQKKLPGAGSDSQKAILILADNTTIALNEVNNGSIAEQGNSKVQKSSSGKLVYSFKAAPENERASSNETGYNTIQTPRGGEYQVVLDDGTRIWLNAASTIRFPVHFNGDERRVTLTGEAYFEVASSISPATGHKKTFTVRVNDIDVQAIGTAFNINAYKEDKLTQTTVVEGLVKVSSNNRDQLLPPGKKLVAQDSSFTVEDADVKQEIAWKNGQFVFHNTSLEAVMNGLARWYNVEIVYKQTMPSLHFTGQIEKQATIDRVLEMLELTGGVRFTVKGQVVQVYRASSTL